MKYIPFLDKGPCHTAPDSQSQKKETNVIEEQKFCHILPKEKEHEGLLSYRITSEAKKAKHRVNLTSNFTKPVSSFCFTSV